MTIETKSRNLRISTNESNTEIVIPARREWTQIVLFLLCTPVAFIGGSAGLNAVQKNSFSIPEVFVTFAIAGAIIALVCAIAHIFWLIVGTEEVNVGNGILVLKKQIFGFGITRKFEIGLIRNLRFCEPHILRDIFVAYQDFVGQGRGAIRFRYKSRVVTFGRAIDDLNGRTILEALRRNGNFNDTNFA